MVARDGWVAVGEARSIVNVSRCIASPRQSVLTADVQRVPLVVVKKLEALANGEVRESAVDVSETKRKLVRVGQINLSAIADARRAQGQLPPIDPRPLNRNRKENVGVIQIVVVEEVVRTCEEIVGIEGPPVEW